MFRGKGKKRCTRGKKPRLTWWEIHLLHKHVLEIVCFSMVNGDHPGNMKLASSAIEAIILRMYFPAPVSLLQGAIKRVLNEQNLTQSFYKS